MTAADELDAVAALMSMRTIRAGQIDYYVISPPVVVKSAFAWPSVPTPATSPARSPRHGWSAATVGHKSYVKVRCTDAAYGLEIGGRKIVTFYDGGTAYAVTLPAATNTGRIVDIDQQCSVLSGSLKLSAEVTCRQASRRVVFSTDGTDNKPIMKRIQEYTVANTDKSPQFVIQIRPAEPAVWSIRESP